jgi:hypothetical protein
MLLCITHKFLFVIPLQQLEIDFMSIEFILLCRLCIQITINSKVGSITISTSNDKWYKQLEK